MPKKITETKEVGVEEVKNLIREKSKKLFDREPSGSLVEKELDELAEEICRLLK